MPKSATAPEKSTKKIDLELLKESQLVELAIRLGSPLSKSNIRANKVPKIIEHINEIVEQNNNQDLLKELYAEMKETVKKIDASNVNTVTITSIVPELIDGADSLVLETDGRPSVDIISDGVNWWLI